jgi:hypothetical protein
MPRYQWQEKAAIQQLDIRETLRYPVALLRLDASLDAATLHAIPATLQRHGLIATPESEDGKPCLRVRGFKDSEALLQLLKQEGLTPAQPATVQLLEEEANPEVQTLRRYIKDHSIQLAGAVYLIADAMPIASGVVRKTPAEVTQGLLWATTSAGLLFFGRKNPEVQVGNIYTKMRDFMAHEGVPIADDPALALQQLQRDPSYWNMLVNFLYDHPVLFNNSLQGYGGIKQAQAGKAQGNPFKSGAGAAVAVGQWGGLIIPEDKYAGLDAQAKAERLAQRAAGEEPENGFHTRFLDNPVHWIQEKPLRLTAIGPIIGNFLTTASALFHDRHKVNEHFGIASNRYELNPSKLWQDATRDTNALLQRAGVSKDALLLDRTKPEAQRSYLELEKMLGTQIGWKFTMMTPVFNIIANTLYGMSSKEERSVNLDKEGYLDEILGVAANIYAHIPDAAARNEKIIRFAGFLRSQPDVKLSEAAIRERINARIDGLEKAGWVEKLQHSPAAGAMAGAALS